MKDLIKAVDKLRDRLAAQCKQTEDGVDIVARSLSASDGCGPYLVELSIELVEEDSPQGRVHARAMKAACEKGVTWTGVMPEGAPDEIGFVLDLGKDGES